MGGAQTLFERDLAPKIPRKPHSGIHGKQAAPRGLVLHLSGQQVIDTRWFKMRLKTLNNNNLSAPPYADLCMHVMCQRKNGWSWAKGTLCWNYSVRITSTPSKLECLKVRLMYACIQTDLWPSFFFSSASHHHRIIRRLRFRFSSGTKTSPAQFSNSIAIHFQKRELQRADCFHIHRSHLLIKSTHSFKVPKEI